MDPKGNVEVEKDLGAAIGLQHGSPKLAMDAESNGKRQFELASVPPDGGYGWIIVASALTLSLLLLR